MTALDKITKKRQKDLLELFGYVWDENLEKCREKFPVRKDYQKYRLEQYLGRGKAKETEKWNQN
ncbi:MAG: hypothetical protein WCV56_08360 [Candidatus Omnitrophota bacterium]